MSAESIIKSAAMDLGFSLAGIASLEQAPQSLQRYPQWLSAQYHGDMAYLERQAEKRMDPSLILPGAKSMVCLGLLYNTDKPYSTQAGQPWVSRYAWGEDYHAVMETKLRALLQAMRQRMDTPFEAKHYCDTGPISEKAWAAAAGLGWIGKNTNLIHPQQGSWFFLGEILTSLELVADQPATDLCGSCRRCLDACPTGAFPEAYTLDARRCISYLTIEQRGEIPEEFHDAIGLNLYGCDICQDVCPWNHWKITGNEAAFQPRPENWNPDAAALANISDEEFSRLYNGSSMKRAKAKGLRRNAAIVKANLDKKP
jgi:epoxyqueuosine reductase